ncbi:YtxH domain-containing protein [Nonomuraea sp. MCN248]|uniref:YtxH domain-containing protein n=1 Tax=Nonomuraea corallina TaxID=2989783 RepID=A0ABT4SKH8_9ACTN|nr:YtxH domain-containing protein [Nonomuraea corallina]MDA0637639.1 YtxH domain-containing protein [Nonomuraea corallina]
MRYRMPFVMGLAVGYVLGSRAGRERYEQIKRTAQRVADNPRVQEAAGVMGAKASKVGEMARSKMSGPLQEKMPFGKKDRTGTDADQGTGWPDEKVGGTTASDRTGIPY